MFAVRIFSAYAVTSAEKITLATMTNWRSCIFLVRDGPFPHAWSTPPGKQQWRHRSRDDFSYLMRAPPARRRPLGNNATAPQSTRRLAQFLRRRCCRPRRRLTLAGKYQGRGRRHSYVAQLFRRHWFCVAPGWKLPPGTQESTGGTCLGCFAHVCLSPPGWSIPPIK